MIYSDGMKQALSYFCLVTVVNAQQNSPVPPHSQSPPHGHFERIIFASVIVVLGLLWAVKNKFTDYP
jgi:hypothetical protein